MRETGYKPLKFFLKVILPSITTVVLFILAFILFILPEFEQNVMERKREMIRELTNTTWSILLKYEKDVTDSVLSVQTAQKLAAEEIKKLRYGIEKKDYYWITDITPRMVMHPYRSDLDGKLLDDFKDYQGKKMFVEMAKIAKTQNEGYVEYIWQWKDDPKQKVPKLSYVKLFKPWNWIIGTGIYVQDVKTEIDELENNLLIISSILVILSLILLSFIVFRSYKIERQYIEAEYSLKESREKYKALTESTTDGIIMLSDNGITFSNRKMQELSGYSELELFDININDLFLFDDNLNIDFKKEGLFELTLKTKREQLYDVLLNVLPITYADKKVCVLSVKYLSDSSIVTKKSYEMRTFYLDDEKDQVIFDLQAQYSYLNLPIKTFVKNLIFAKSTESLNEIVDKFKLTNNDALFVKENNIIIGIISKQDIIERAFNSNEKNLKAHHIMTSPIQFAFDNIRLSELLIFLKKINQDTIAVKNLNNEFIGTISIQDIFKEIYINKNIFYSQIENAESDSDIKNIHRKLPLLIKPMIINGINTSLITSITTEVADRITKKIIDKAISQIGNPPVKFAFIILGSQSRCEQTLSTDQDNAIIYEDTDIEDCIEVRQYFNKLGNYVCDLLNDSGYAFCKGNIMAKNEKWCQPISVWKNYYQNWIYNYDPQTILDFSIFLDFKIIYGSEEIVDSLRVYMKELLISKPAFLYQLAQNMTMFKPPVGIFGGIILENVGTHSDTIDIKHAMQPILLFARLYSIQNDFKTLNTIERIKALAENKSISLSFAENITFSYDFLMHLRLNHQLNQIFSSQIADNHIYIKKLTDIEQTIIKKIFSSYSSIFTKVKNDYKGIT